MRHFDKSSWPVTKCIDGAAKLAKVGATKRNGENEMTTRTREQAIALGFKIGDIETIGQLRGAAFELCEALRGDHREHLATQLHDTLCFLLQHDSDEPLEPIA